MARGGLCKHFGIQSQWDTSPLYPAPRVVYPEKGETGQEAILSVLRQAFDILIDDSELRALASMDSKGAAENFDVLRNRHPLHHEFRHFLVELTAKNSDLAGKLAALGFNTRVVDEKY